MILVKQSELNYSVDISPLEKTQYTTYALFVNDVEVSGSTTNLLPYVFTVAVGLNEIKLLLKNTTESKEYKKCTLDNANLECDLNTYLITLETKELLNSTLPFLYFLIKESTILANQCDCYCDSLKKLYLELSNQIYNQNCC
jgi:hypothetical protein